MNNLAADPAHSEIKARLSAELDRWMKSQGDPGVPQDTHKAHQAARRGQHLYGPDLGQGAGKTKKESP
jgi:uncharacterized sulfatase